MNRPRVPAKWRRAAAERARGLCEYCRCQLQFSADPFEVEHIIPRSQRGQTVSNNLALACRGCNFYKSDKTTAIDPISNRHEHYPA